MLDVLVTEKKMSQSEITSREKVEREAALEVERDGDGGEGELSNAHNNFECTQQTTHHIEQWTVPL